MGGGGGRRRRRSPSAHSMQIPKAGSRMENNILSDCILSTYAIIRNVLRTIYDVYMSYFKLAFNITIVS
jgi:hypothetical protein